ncbi:hypothetical protein ACFWC9_41025 [Streptomyces goshikiensis]|uniref:hypothetical protein n=1 Tax=Streptomyces goshikiensis TaxID=1942 RepID=UPI0036C5B5F5
MHRKWLTTLVMTAALTGIGMPLAVAAPGSTDATYVRKAHQGNLAEIAAGQDAQTNGKDACVKDVWLCS